MTQTQLNNIIIKTKCCFARLADELATQLSIGGCDNYKELAILEDYIEQLQKYNLESETNCLNTDQIENIIEQAKNICDLCDCGTH